MVLDRLHIGEDCSQPLVFDNRGVGDALVLVERPVAQGQSLPPHVDAPVREGVDVDVFIDKPARDFGFVQMIRLRS